MHDENRGSITIEAAIALPVFICVVVSLTMLIKLIYIHDIMQHAIDEAANDIAAYSYIYHVSELQKIDESIEENLSKGSERAEMHIKAVVDAFSTLDNASKGFTDQVDNLNYALSSDASFFYKAGEILTKAKEFQNASEVHSRAGIDSMNKLYQALAEACKDPKKEAESIAWMLTELIYDDIKAIAAVPIIKFTTKRYLQNSRNEDVDKRLRKLNIYNGFEGLDFYSSTIFAGDQDIDIIVGYKVELPLPIKLLPDIYILQRSTARAWLNGGDGMSILQASIWDLPNKQRGMKIEELYGGNLPYDFPIIDIYDATSNAGTSIKSINLNNKTYQDSAKLTKVLKQYVDDINNRNTISYKEQVYVLAKKKLIIVIPKGALNGRNSEVLEQIKAYSAACGIDITISEL